MSTTVAAPAPAQQSTARGRTRITSTALQRVVGAVAGDALGVEAKHVDADLTDHGGTLDLTVHAPITVISIARLQAEPGALERSGGSILDRCAAAEHTIRDRVGSMTGYTIHRVTVRLSDIRIKQEKRVK